eukprot:gene28859-35797_t
MWWKILQREDNWVMVTPLVIAQQDPPEFESDLNPAGVASKPVPSKRKSVTKVVESDNEEDEADKKLEE